MAWAVEAAVFEDHCSLQLGQHMFPYFVLGEPLRPVMGGPKI